MYAMPPYLHRVDLPTSCRYQLHTWWMGASSSFGLVPTRLIRIYRITTRPTCGNVLDRVLNRLAMPCQPPSKLVVYFWVPQPSASTSKRHMRALAVPGPFVQ